MVCDVVGDRDGVLARAEQGPEPWVTRRGENPGSLLKTNLRCYQDAARAKEMKFLESVSAAVLTVVFLPVLMVGCGAALLDRKWPVFRRELREGSGDGLGWLRFNTGPGERDLFLKRFSMTYLPSLIQVVAGRVRLADALALMERRR